MSALVNNILIWGASGHAKVVLSALKNNHKIIGFIDKNPNIKEFAGNAVYRNFSEFSKNVSIDSKEIYFIIAIGGARGSERMDIHNQLIKSGLKPMSVIHPSAWVDASACIEPGAQILAMAAISAEVVIGSQTIVNTNATIDHETQVGDGCHIMPAATVTGCVTIGNFCTIGSNATILPRISLNPHTIVGAGAVVTKNTPPNITVVGIPAKNILNKDKL